MSKYSDGYMDGKLACARHLEKGQKQQLMAEITANSRSRSYVNGCKRAVRERRNMGCK